MNVGLGLFRAWVVISLLWSAGIVAYGIVSDDAAQGNFAPNDVLKDRRNVEWGGLAPHKPDKQTFQESYRSPSAEKLIVTFRSVDWRQRMDFDTDADTIKVDMPDGSSIYMHAAYNDADRNYIAKQFWDQRWGRWGRAAGIVALWAFVPSALLFILGYALLWIGRGFKRA